LEGGREVALSAPASAESASNPPFLKLADSRQLSKKKEEKTQKLSRSGGTARYYCLKNSVK